MFDNKLFISAVFLKYQLLLVAVLFLSACATSVKVTGEIPTPLVEKLPLTVEIIYDDDFKSYIYEEEEKGRGLKSIAFGEAQIALIDSIFSHLFTLIEPNELGVNVATDLKVTPTLLDFQYSAPRETKLNLYEIWLKYRIKIEDSNDREVADWIVKGYGKTPTALLNSASKAFDSATNVALRDVGAQLAIGFSTQPEIKEFLSNHPSSKSSANINLVQDVDSVLREEQISTPTLVPQETSEE